MSKLLRAGIARYLKNPLFLLTAVVSLGAGLIAGLRAELGIDDMYFIALFVIFASFISLLVGREHGDGGFRNKLIKGFGKGEIYICEWILHTGFCLVMALLAIGGYCITGHGALALIPGAMLGKILFGILCDCIATVSLILLVCMLISHRAVSAILAILLVVGLMFASYELDSLLSKPEFYVIEMMNEDNDVISTRKKENPWYVGGFARDVLTQVTYALPFGQIEYYCYFLQPSVYETRDFDGLAEHYVFSVSFSEQARERIGLFPLYSLVLTAFAGAVGYTVFRRKALK